ncbi:MAG: hypothetical protein XE05_0496, partial [Thermotogales bacterium 46_20]
VSSRMLIEATNYVERFSIRSFMLAAAVIALKAAFADVIISLNLPL